MHNAYIVDYSTSTIILFQATNIDIKANTQELTVTTKDNTETRFNNYYYALTLEEAQAKLNTK